MNADSELPVPAPANKASTAWIVPALVGFAVGVALQTVVMLQFVQPAVDSVGLVGIPSGEERATRGEHSEPIDPTISATTSAVDGFARAGKVSPAPYVFVFEQLSETADVDPVTRISLSAATDTSDVARAIAQDAHIGTYPLSCHDQLIDSSHEETALFRESLSSATCWYAGGGIQLGIFLRIVPSGPIISVEGRTVGECGMVADCKPYGALRQLYTIALDPPYAVARPETFSSDE